MNSKTTISIMVMAITAFAMVAMPIILETDHAFAYKKCNPHGCKGTKGYYTVKGHHHCYEGSPGCKRTGHYHE
jgi:hypothetical protein